MELAPELTAAMKNKYCALTTDGCTEDTSKAHFYTMTAQYLATVEGKWALKSKVLFTTRFKKSGKYTAADVRAHLSDSCDGKSFNPALIEALTFVTDGGSDIVKALSDCNRLYCFDHFLNVCLTNGFEVKVYQLNLYTEEARILVDDVLKVIEEMKKKPIGQKFLPVMPKGRTKGPFPSKLPLLRVFQKQYNKVNSVFFCFF